MKRFLQNQKRICPAAQALIFYNVKDRREREEEEEEEERKEEEKEEKKESGGKKGGRRQKEEGREKKMALNYTKMQYHNAMLQSS